MYCIQKSKIDLLHGIPVPASFQTTGCAIILPKKKLTNPTYPEQLSKATIFRSGQLQQMDLQSMLTP
jgi:hypothetical protein